MSTNAKRAATGAKNETAPGANRGGGNQPLGRRNRLRGNRTAPKAAAPEVTVGPEIREVSRAKFYEALAAFSNDGPPESWPSVPTADVSFWAADDISFYLALAMPRGSPKAAHRYNAQECADDKLNTGQIIWQEQAARVGAFGEGVITFSRFKIADAAGDLRSAHQQIHITLRDLGVNDYPELLALALDRISEVADVLGRRVAEVIEAEAAEAAERKAGRA